MLNVTDLENMLANGDLKIASGNRAQDIKLMDAITWGSPTRLVLDAYHSIVFNVPVTVAGRGAVTLTTNDGGMHGDYYFAAAGHIEFWDEKSQLSINGNSYKLVARIDRLSKLIAKTPSGFFALSRTDTEKRRPFSTVPITEVDGVVEGLGNTIDDLTINDASDSFVGLIGTIGAAAAIRDITLGHVSIQTPSTSWAGGLAAVNYGAVTAAHIHGSITSDGTVGGLVGYNFGSIRNSSASVVVRSSGNYCADMGGLVGSQSGAASIIENSSSTGAIVSVNCDGVGGLAGSSDGMVRGSRATGSVTGFGTSMGGLLGTNGGIVLRSFATGQVVGSDCCVDAGGLVGYNSGTIDRSFATGAAGNSEWVGGLVAENWGSISNSYASGSVFSAIIAVGGFGGINQASISQAYSIGNVNGTGATVAYGGFLGEGGSSASLMQNGFWDLDTSGVRDPDMGCGGETNCPGVTGLTDPQLKSGLPVGFDPSVWSEDPNINDGYPYLIANPPPK